MASDRWTIKTLSDIQKNEEGFKLYSEIVGNLPTLAEKVIDDKEGVDYLNTVVMGLSRALFDQNGDIVEELYSTLVDIQLSLDDHGIDETLLS